MVRHRKLAAARAGVAVTEAELERGAVDDLIIVEALKRGHDPTRQTKRTKPQKAEAVAAAAPEPARPFRIVNPGELDIERIPLLHSRPAAISRRWAAAVERLRLIMEGAAPAPTHDEMLATANCPDLALDWWKLYASFRFRHRDTRHNPFRDMSNRDAARALMRWVEDICDRSTGRLGPWQEK